MTCLFFRGFGVNAFALIVALCTCACHSQHVPTPPTPDDVAAVHYISPTVSLESMQSVQGHLKKALPHSLPVAVALYDPDRTVRASGCIISKDGLILTAAHVVDLFKRKKKTFSGQLPDGRGFRAVPYAANLSSDVALLKITDPKDTSWITARMADASPPVGDLIYLLGYPERISEVNHPQLRIGMVKSIRKMGRGTDIPVMVVSDANIQPGDSGAPVFNVDGELIGLASSAGGPVGYNRFVPVERIHYDMKRLKKQEFWGDIRKGPTRTQLKYRLDKRGIYLIKQEFRRQLKLRYPEALALHAAVPATDTDPGDQDLVKLVGTAIEPVTMEQPYAAGTNAPEVLTALTSMCKKPSATILKLVADGEQVCFAVAVSDTLAVTKQSLLTPDVRVLVGHTPLKPVSVATAPDWDLALIRINAEAPLIPVAWSATSKAPAPGSLVVTIGTQGKCLGWGVVAGAARAVGDPGTTPSPFPDKHLISTHRGPYKSVIPHDAPIFANAMGSVVLDLQGRINGVNIARKNRTQALMIPAKEMAVVVKRMMAALELKEK